ncbi:MAG: glycosyltransferase, partial [Chloroflexota bacterium]
ALEAGDIGGFAESIRALARDQERRECLARTARQRVLDEYSPERVVDVFRHVYRRAAGNETT